MSWQAYLDEARARAAATGRTEHESLMEIFLRDLEAVRVPPVLAGDVEAAQEYWLGGRRGDLDDAHRHVWDFIEGRLIGRVSTDENRAARALLCVLDEDPDLDAVPDVADFFDQMMRALRGGPYAGPKPLRRNGRSRREGSGAR